MSSTTNDANVILVGMPGVGKSTVGVLLAKTLNRDFVDTDVVIQSREGRSLQQIIREDGREQFCELEEQYVLDLDLRNTVVATGGSVVYSATAMDHLASSGTVVHLNASLELVQSRVKNTGERGVVMMPGQTLEELYHERQPLYRQWAEITVDTDDSNPEQVIDALVGKMRKFKVRS